MPPGCTFHLLGDMIMSIAVLLLEAASIHRCGWSGTSWEQESQQQRKNTKDQKQDPWFLNSNWQALDKAVLL
jgi:hypothetical protein